MTFKAAERQDDPRPLSDERRQMLLEDGIRLAVRNNLPEAALHIIGDSLNPQTYRSDQYLPGNKTASPIARAAALLAMRYSPDVHLY